MKKLTIVALALMVAGVAFASSLNVPWFVDNSAAASKFPPVSPGVSGIVYLHNNKTETITCSIAYYSQEGVSLGPAAPGNTFVIAANASIAFRPVAYDPDSVTGGQEAVDAGLLVPDRPTVDGKKNGSLVVTWLGEATDVQGIYTMNQYAGGINAGKLVSYAYLLPPGA